MDAAVPAGAERDAGGAVGSSSHSCCEGEESHGLPQMGSPGASGLSVGYCGGPSAAESGSGTSSSGGAATGTTRGDGGGSSVHDVWQRHRSPAAPLPQVAGWNSDADGDGAWASVEFLHNDLCEVVHNRLLADSPAGQLLPAGAVRSSV